MAANSNLYDDELRRVVDEGSTTRDGMFRTVLEKDVVPKYHFEAPSTCLSLADTAIRADDVLNPFETVVVDPNDSNALVHSNSDLSIMFVHTVPGVVSLFSERGLYSNHIYQPDVNHRELKFDHMNGYFIDSEGKQREPIMKSALWAETDAEKFDMATQIGIYLYEVVDTAGLSEEEKDTDSVQYGCMRSHGQLRPEDASVSCFSYIDNRTTRPLTVGGLKRCLRVFGLEFQDTKSVYSTDDSFVGLHDIVAFFKLFAGHNMNTVPAFMEFLDGFRMGSLYRYDDSVDLEDNVWRFGHLVRSLVAMRVGIYDGQHRGVAMAQSAVGIYSVTAMVPLKRTKIEEALPSVHLKTDKVSPQVWRSMLFQVGTPTDKSLLESNKTVVGVYSKFGAAVTTAQDLSIKPTFDSFVGFVVKRVATQLQRDIGFKKTGWSSYWSSSASKNVSAKSCCTMLKRLEIAWRALLNFVDTDPLVYRPYIMSIDAADESSWKEHFTGDGTHCANFSRLAHIPHSQGSAISGTLQEEWGATKSTRPKLTKWGGYLLSVLKACAWDVQQLRVLEEMFRSFVPKHEQFPRQEPLPLINFRSISWIASNVVEPLTCLRQHLVRKILIEVKIMLTSEQQAIGERDARSEERICGLNEEVF